MRAQSRRRIWRKMQRPSGLCSRIFRPRPDPAALLSEAKEVFPALHNFQKRPYGKDMKKAAQLEFSLYKKGATAFGGALFHRGRGPCCEIIRTIRAGNFFWPTDTNICYCSNFISFAGRRGAALRIQKESRSRGFCSHCRGRFFGRPGENRKRIRQRSLSYRMTR